MPCSSVVLKATSKFQLTSNKMSLIGTSSLPKKSFIDGQDQYEEVVAGMGAVSTAERDDRLSKILQIKS